MSTQNNSNGITRRQFLGEASCAALGTTGLFSTLMNLQMTRKVAAAEMLPGDDYKALVCIFLSGGNDSFNMLVPTTAGEYDQYAAVRSNLALRFDDSSPSHGAIHDIDALETDGRTYGLNPAMVEIQQLFNEGNVGFLSNVGTLLEPMTVLEYQQKQKLIPYNLFSHSDQVMQWQTSAPQGAVTGWAGRMADILHTQSNNLDSVSMNISLAGNNFWQTGLHTAPYTITPNGSVTLAGKNSAAGSIDGLQYSLVGSDDEDENSLAGQLYRNLFEQAYLDEFRTSMELDEIFTSAFDPITLTTEFDNSLLANRLKAVAKTIAARETLGMRRQVFFVQLGGWDNHGELVETHYRLLRQLSSAMKQFWDALGELGVQDDVLTFTASDFARTLRSNGRGTDHAWGGNQMIMGGNVKGQRIHGQYPTAAEMQLAGGLDVSRNGRLLPTTSVDEYMAEMALWFGVSPSALSDVFPNILNFYNPYSGQPPIGFLN